MSKYETTKDGLVKDTETGATGIFRTVGGRRIFIKDGQDLASAMKESGKFSKKENKNNETKAKEYKTLEEQIEYIKQDEEKLLKAIDESSNSEEAGKRICEVLQERQGFNEKPKLLDEKDFNDLSDDKYIKLYRGISDGEKTADEYIEQFKNGKNEYGKGLNAYGVGHYTSEDKNVAESYGKTIEIALPKEAKIGVINMNDYDINDINELSAKNFRPYINDMEKYYNKYGDDITRIIDELEREPSTYAIMQGYDAIKVIDNQNSSAGGTYIILNRGKVMVKK